MFQAARSASLIGLPKRGLSASGCTGCGDVVPIQMPFERLGGRGAATGARASGDQRGHRDDGENLRLGR